MSDAAGSSCMRGVGSSSLLQMHWARRRHVLSPCHRRLVLPQQPPLAALASLVERPPASWIAASAGPSGAAPSPEALQLHLCFCLPLRTQAAAAAHACCGRLLALTPILLALHTLRQALHQQLALGCSRVRPALHPSQCRSPACRIVLCPPGQFLVRMRQGCGAPAAGCATRRLAEAARKLWHAAARRCQLWRPRRARHAARPCTPA